MPGMYAQGDYDLAGFVVGVVDKTKIIDGRNIKAGHRIVGVASSGPHSNGYSLIRRLIEDCDLDLSADFDGSTLGQKLLQATTLYPKPVLSLLAKDTPVLGMAHITGGGLMENINRVLPGGLAVEIYRSSWPIPKIFSYLQELGQIEEAELLKTFNTGIGLCLIVPEEAVDETISHFQSQQLDAWSIGQITEHTGQNVTLI
jgi:phosphoribosylformylglycinamidine cyclo-ligase (EC 6.3.3.1)